MISDSSVKNDIEGRWQAIRAILSIVGDQYPGNVSNFGVFTVSHPPKIPGPCNLPLILAFGAFDECLKQMVVEKVFKCDKSSLGGKMFAAKLVLKWENFELLDQGRDDRNRTVHRDGKLHSDEVCKKYIYALEAQTRAWGIID